MTGPQSRTLPLLSSPCNVPQTAKAYSLNVTAVPHSPQGVSPYGQPGNHSQFERDVSNTRSQRLTEACRPNRVAASSSISIRHLRASPGNCVKFHRIAPSSVAIA